MYNIGNMLFYGDDFMPFLLLFDLIILLLIRFFIKIVITIFGWATSIFFGKLPEKNRVWFYIMMILSFVWVYCMVAKVFPVLLNIFSYYVPERSFTKIMKHLLYILCLIAIPPAVGALGAMITGVSRTDKKNFVIWLIKGYKYTIILGVTMAVMLVCTPVIRIKRILRHIVAEDMPMEVAGNGNIRVMDEIIYSLGMSGMRAVKKVPSKFYSVPAKMINGTLKELFNYVSDREMYITGENLSVYLNSTDIMIEGSRDTVERAKIAIVRGFVENNIYLTESRNSRKVELEILTIYNKWKDGQSSSDDALAALRKVINSGFEDSIAYNDWALLSMQINVIQNKVLVKKTNLENL